MRTPPPARSRTAGETTPQRLQQTDVHSAPRTDSTEVQQQQRRDAGRGSLGSQAQGIRTRAAGVLHGGMKNRVAQPEVEAEHQPGWPDHLDDGGKIGKGLEGFQAHDDLAGAAGEHFERAAGQAGAGIDQQRAGEAGVELGQLPNQRSLERAALDGVEVGDVALVDTEDGVKRTQQCECVSGAVRHQVGCQWRVAAAVPGLGMYGHATGQVQHGNDLHA